MIDYISMRPQSCHTDAVLAGNDVCKGLRCIAKLERAKSTAAAGGRVG